MPETRSETVARLLREAMALESKAKYLSNVVVLLRGQHYDSGLLQIESLRAEAKAKREHAAGMVE